MANNKSQDQSPTEDIVTECNIKTIDNELVCAGGLDITLCPASQAVLNQRSKTPSFQITSVYVGSNSRTSNEGGNDSADDLDESDTSDFSVDTSRVTDAENESSYCADDTFPKDEPSVYIDLTRRTIASVPVIPTSSQYGLAIVGSEGENCANNSGLIKAAMVCANNISTCDASVAVTETGSILNMIDNTKSDIEIRDCPPQHASRNERFRVVKIVSTEPFKCGRWECMDYLDQNILQLKKSQLDVINSIKQFGSDSSTGTLNFIPADSRVGVADNLSCRNLDEPVEPSHFTPVPQDSHFTPVPQDSQFITPQNSANLPSVQAQPSLPNNISPGHSVNQEHVQFPLVTSTQNSTQAQGVNNPSGHLNPQFQQWMNQPQQNHHQPPQQSNPQLQDISQSPFNPQLQHNLQTHNIAETQPNIQYPTSIQATQPVPSQDTQVIYQPQYNYSQPQEMNSQDMQHLAQQVQGATPTSVANLLPPEALRSLPAQQLQQLVNNILHQIGSQQDEAHKQQLVQQISHQLQQQYRQNLLPTVETSSGNPAVSGSLQSSQTIASTMPMQNSGSGLSQNLQMAQMQQQQQQQQHMIGLNQQTVQPVATKQTQYQQVPVQLQYTVQQQYPAQHNNQFQPFPVQQVPLVQLFPVCQQQSLQIPTQQQQILQQNYQQNIPNVQPPGHQFARSVPVGDSQSAPNLSQVHNASQSGLIHVPVARRSPSLHNQSVAASRSELFFTPPTSQTDKGITSSRSMSAVQVDATSPVWFGGNGSCRFEMTSERPSLERLVSGSGLDIESGRGVPETSPSGTSVVAIDNKIEQAMDLVKSHLMFAVREEVEVLKEKIAELMERIAQLEAENTLLRSHATPEILAIVNTLPHQQPTPTTQYPPKDLT